VRKNLQPNDLGDFLEQPRLATLATHFVDGTILLSPVWYEWRDGGFTILIGNNEVKTRHLKRDPRASIVVAEDVLPYRGIEVRGEATFSTDGLPEALLRLATRYLGTEAGRRYVNRVDPSDQIGIRLVPGVLRAWDFADEEY
jgi:PPOX class probable F420-dependent enzyme